MKWDMLYGIESLLVNLLKNVKRSALAQSSTAVITTVAVCTPLHWQIHNIQPSFPSSTAGFLRCGNPNFGFARDWKLWAKWAYCWQALYEGHLSRGGLVIGSITLRIHCKNHKCNFDRVNFHSNKREFSCSVVLWRSLIWAQQSIPEALHQEHNSNTTHWQLHGRPG